MSRQFFNRLGPGFALFIYLGGCTPFLHDASNVARPENPSTRFSECFFEVRFQGNTADVDANISSTLREVLQLAGRQQIPITTRSTVGEESSLSSRRAAALRHELRRLGVPNDRIVDNQVIDRVDAESGATIGICGLQTATPRRHPADSDRKILFVEGSRRLNIPLRYLHPYYWNDVPYGPVRGLPDSIVVVKPNFLGRGLEGTERCFVSAPSPCALVSIGLRSRIDGSPTPVETSPNGLDNARRAGVNRFITTRFGTLTLGYVLLNPLNGESPVAECRVPTSPSPITEHAAPAPILCTVSIMLSHLDLDLRISLEFETIGQTNSDVSAAVRLIEGFV